MHIPVSFTHLQHIIHIADVHIRLFRRHEEYEAAFERLYNDLRTYDLTQTVIVLAGDVVHAKTDMSPEMVQVTSRFLTQLADIAPTILIAGNHDCNLANTNRLDTLSPIVKNLNHPQLHYIRDSAVMTVADCKFAILSIFDEQEQWPTAQELDDSFTKIALYHGPVHGATTDANFAITNRHVHVDTFAGFDMVLLGDIHRAQTLQAYDAIAKKPVIVYPGSLIQQNHGETYDGHGWCWWDVPTRSYEFVPLQNDYGYVTLEVVNGNIVYPKTMPTNVRMRLFTADLDTTEVKKIITTLRTNYNIIELSVNKTRMAKTFNRTQVLDHNILDLQQVSTQNTLLVDWLSRNYPGLDPDILTEIQRINKSMNNAIVHDDQSRNIHWRPLKFTFSNMFSYGENNEIDFSEMKGLYGIFAANASGKSSIMDALMFCLYDKTPRAFKGDHIINNRKDAFECELTFEINNEIFGIKRMGSRKKNGDVKVDVRFWKVLDNGEHHNLNGEDRRDTNANIRSYVGTYEDFVMTALSSQNSNALFIDKSHSERKDLLIQFMGLNIFDKLFDAAHGESKEIAGVLKRFKKSDVTDQLAETQQKLTMGAIDMSAVEDRKSAYEIKMVNLTDTYKSKHSEKRPVPDVSGSRDNMERELMVAQQKLEETSATIIKLDTQIAELEELSVQYLAQMSDIDIDQVEKSVERYTVLAQERTKILHDQNITVAKLEEKMKFEKQLKEYKYNPECEVCVVNNAKVIDDLGTVASELQLLNNRIVEYTRMALTVELEMEPLQTQQKLYGHFYALESTNNKTESQVTKLINDREKLIRHTEKLDLTIAEYGRQLELYAKNEENINHNQTIDKKLLEIQKQIDTVREETKRADAELRDVHGKVSVLQSKREELQARLKEAEDLETTYEAFNHYMIAVGRDGIPYELMGKAIPNIEAEINAILSQIVDFTVSLEVDGKNINGKLNYDYDRVWPLENSSGMERFISSLAIRVALMNASNLPKSNFLIIDEGFATLDAEHIHAMQTLFNILKTHFDFILIVSHLDAMRDMVDHLIEIKKEDGYSQISV